MKLEHKNFNGIENTSFSSKVHRKKSEDNTKPIRPAERLSAGGSERLSGEVAFGSNDPKFVTNVAGEVINKTFQKTDISNFAKKMGGADWFKKALKTVDKNEAVFDLIIALGVAGVLKPLFVLAMPGAEPEDKQMAATKNSVSAFIGFALGTLILSPISTGINKVTKSFSSAKPDKYIKDAAYRAKLLSEDVSGSMKSTLGDSFKSTYKKMAGIGVAPLKAGITMALVPHIVNAIFPNNKKKRAKERKKSLSKMPVMNLLKMEAKKEQAPAFAGKTKNIAFGSATKRNSKNNVAFGSGIAQVIDITGETAKSKTFIQKLTAPYNEFLGKKVVAPVIGKVATWAPFRKLVSTFSKFESPSAAWSHLESLAITFFYVNNTRKSKTMDEERKLPLMINNVMVTVASSAAAVAIDKVTDKPMEGLLRGYVRKHDADLMNKANKSIKRNLNSALKNGADTINLEEMKNHSAELLKGGVESLSENMKEAIGVLRKDGTIQEAIQKGIIKAEDVEALAVSGFRQQANNVFKNIKKAKSLTVFTLTVRFLVTVLMTPVIGRVVAMVNKKLGKDSKGRDIKKTPDDPKSVGLKDYMKTLNK